MSKILKEILSTVTKRICFNNICCWLDIEIELCWIKGKEQSWRSRVENRVENIRKVVDTDRWFYVEVLHNPAEFFNRAVSSEEILRNCFNGSDIFYKENALLVEFDLAKRSRLVDEIVKSELKGKGSSRLREKQSQCFKVRLVSMVGYKEVINQCGFICFFDVDKRTFKSYFRRSIYFKIL